MITTDVLPLLASIVGTINVKTSDADRIAYGTDAMKRGKPADVVVLPANAQEVAQVVRVCAEHRLPMVPRSTTKTSRSRPSSSASPAGNRPDCM